MASKTLLLVLSFILVAAIATADLKFEGTWIRSFDSCASPWTHSTPNFFFDLASAVDILHRWKTKLTDPNNVLQSWDPALGNACTWFHITCDVDNRVTRLWVTQPQYSLFSIFHSIYSRTRNRDSVHRRDLGNAGLSGPLLPELGLLTHLEYL